MNKFQPITPNHHIHKFHTCVKLPFLKDGYQRILDKIRYGRADLLSVSEFNGLKEYFVEITYINESKNKALELDRINKNNLAKL
jgi:hypothetical protein